MARYGISKDGAVGVAVGVGPMHCLLPHCGGPHHHHHLSAAHPQNPQSGHNHHVHPAHHPPPAASPHLNHQLSHHQLTVNINHLNHQQQQQQQQNQHQQTPPQYRVVTANTRTDFHAPGQNYGVQGGQVGGGGGNVGVPGGRGPPTIGGIQSINQSSTGIPPGVQAGGQQAPPQAQAPGVQAQQPQGPAPTTTPPVHTPSPQEMGKQAHLQAQQQPMQQVYMPSQSRPGSQGFYQGPRPQQPRINHRVAQGGSGATQVVGLPSVPGNGGQPTTMYPHLASIPVPSTMFVQGHGIHHGQSQQPVYSANSPLSVQFAGQPPRHQQHQNQSYYHPPYTPSLVQNMFCYSPGPPQYYYQSHGPALSGPHLRGANTNAVSGGAQHVSGPLSNAQGTAIVPQSSLQQSTQQSQNISAMTMPMPQTDLYAGHNGGAANAANSSMKSTKKRRTKAILDIVDPKTGKNICSEIYADEAATSNSGAEVVADFAARVAKAASEESDASSPAATSSTSDESLLQNSSQSISDNQSSTINGTNTSHCSGSSPTNTQSVSSVPATNSQLLATPNNGVPVDTRPSKTESKLQFPAKEFQPRGDVKSAVVDEHLANANKDNVVSANASVSNEQDVKSTTSNVNQVAPATFPAVPVANQSVEICKPSVTAPNTNLAPVREQFANVSSKTSNSPPRRKSQTAQPAPEQQPKEHNKERKTREKSLNSRGTAPVPTHAQPEHQKPNGDVSDKSEAEATRNDIQQKPVDGKAMQKQKNKSKLKPRDLNRKGAEKEGTDMDAFVNPASQGKSDNKHTDNKDVTSPKDSNRDAITKDIKDKDNYESKKEKESAVEKLDTKEPIEPVKETVDEATKTSNAVSAQQQNKLVPNDVVDHARVNDDADLEAIVAQKNEENSKVSGARVSSEDVPELDNKQPENELASTSEDASSTAPSTANATSATSSESSAPPTLRSTPSLRYVYAEGQWSPVNTDGKKVYDREFLLKLQDDPNSRVRPSNLPDLDVVLKDSTKARAPVDLRAFKEQNRHAFLPDFVKSSSLPRGGPIPMRRSNILTTKPKPTNRIHVSLSLREDVKLRETENAWKPSRLKAQNVPEEDAKTEALYKKVRSVLNKLTPQKFNKLISQVRELKIDSLDRLRGVINLVFEKAVDEPNFSVAYALMCKELQTMSTTGSDNNAETKEAPLNFRKLIIARCQNEFEKNSAEEISRTTKLKEIDECTDPEKKKELQLNLEEEERRIRIKSVGNIRFIGELYKQNMLTTKIMHTCIHTLLQQGDEDSLECLCKLLTTVGAGLEAKDNLDVKNSKDAFCLKMPEYFSKMQEIVSHKGKKKISSRIRFMLQDVIDLRANNWVPRRDDSNPKTIDQITKEAESERLVSQLNNTPINTPRKDDRNNDRKRNRAMGPPEEGGWSQPVSRTRQQYSVETAKLKNMPPAMDDLQLGNRNMFMWKTTPLPSTNSKTPTLNKFACLENISSDQEKRPLQLSGSRSTGPREYGRTEYKSSYEGRSSRNGSQLLGSSSSSRESSLLDNSRTQNMSMPSIPVKSLQQTSSSNYKPEMSNDEFMKHLSGILMEYLKEPNLENVILELRETFDQSQHSKIVRESINHVLEKSSTDRNRIARLMSTLINRNILSVQNFINGFGEVLEIVDDLIIDIPKIWTYLAETLCPSVEEETISLTKLQPLLQTLRSRGCVNKLLGEMLAKMSKVKGPKWVADKWDQSGFTWNDVLDTEKENVEQIIKEYNLEFLTGNFDSAKSSSGKQLSLEQIHDQLKRLMAETSKCNEIHSWITTNVGNRVKDPKFIRTLTTAILETAIEPFNNSWKLKSETFRNLQVLIQRFADANESLELQCLYALQAYMTKLEHPSGILHSIVQDLYEFGIISSDAFLAWQSKKDPTEHGGHSIVMVSLTSFFTNLQEADDASSVEEGSTSVNQDIC